MAKKQKTFAEKALGGKSGVPICPKCGQSFEPVMVINSEKKSDSNAWKFSKTIEKVCKCNEKEVYT